jgi:transposase InsO family protein
MISIEILSIKEAYKAQTESTIRTSATTQLESDTDARSTFGKRKMSTRSAWILDSGSESHLSKEAPPNGPKAKHKPLINIRGISGSGIQVELQEVISLQFNDDEGLSQELELSDTNFAKALRHNLISISKLDEEGYHVLFGDGKAQIFPKGSVKRHTNEKGEYTYVFPKGKSNVIVARKSGGLYRVNGAVRKPRPKVQRALIIEETWGKRKTRASKQLDQQAKRERDLEKRIDKSGMRQEVDRAAMKASRKIAHARSNHKTQSLTFKEWHETLGHVSYSAISKLAVSGSIKVKGGMDKQFCHDCALNKSTRSTPSTKGRNRATRILEVVHSDVCGPFPVRAIGGFRYFVTFIDDFTGYTTTYLIKKKAEVFARFKVFIKQMETRYQLKLAILRTDNGGEYCGSEFKKYCTDSGITHQKTVPHTPNQNGVAERMNRTLLELARTMLSSGKMSLHFWGHAIQHATTIRNHSPTSSINGKIPIQVLTGQDPDYLHFKPFGCPAYGNIVTELRSKLGKTAVYGRFVGCNDGITKAFLIYDPIKRTVFKTSSCSFNSDFDLLLAPRSPPLEPLPEYVTEDELIEYDLYHDGDTILAQEETELILQDEANDEINRTINVLSKSKLTKQEEVRKASAKLRRSARISAINEETKERHERSNPTSVINSLISELYEVKQEWSLIVESTDNSIAPMTMKEALLREDWPKWKEAIDDEYESLMSKKTWARAHLPTGRKAITCKWVLKLKKGDSETDEPRYKARLCARGFNQRYKEDFTEVFAPTIRFSATRLLLAVAAKQNLVLRHLDVKTAFLNGDLEEEIYMKSPEWYNTTSGPPNDGKVCRLQRSLYGLRQAPRQWNKKIDANLKELGFVQSDQEPCVYIKQTNEGIIILALYVDDLVVAATTDRMVDEIRDELSHYFELSDLGHLSWYLGVQVLRNTDTGIIGLSQERYIRDSLVNLEMTTIKPASSPMRSNIDVASLYHAANVVEEEEEASGIRQRLYRKAIGTLMYTMVATRPDIAFAVSFLSRYLDKNGPGHWTMVKRLFGYLLKTADHCLILGRKDGMTDPESIVLTCYVDADWAGCLEDRRSTSGYLIFLGRSLVSWKSEKQQVVAQSTTEAELISANHGTRETVSLRRVASDMGLPQTKATTVYEDNQGCIQLSKNAIMNKRSKHIEVKYFYIRDLVKDETVILEYIPTAEQTADILTKAIKNELFFKFKGQMGVAPWPSASKTERATNEVNPV